MNRRTWLLLSTVFVAALAVLGMVSAASASLPTGPLAPAQSASNSLRDDPFVVNFNCAQMAQFSIEKQMNLRADAIMEKCGVQNKSKPAGGEKSNSSIAGTSGIAAIEMLASPLAYGNTDVNISPGFNNAIQSETFSWQHGNTVIVAYNDLSGGSTGKAARSTDGGATFARLAGDPFATGHGSNLGDPAVVWSDFGGGAGKWVVQFLATGCGGQGVGTWLSTDDGVTWATGPCAANAGSGNGDRNSSWADNNPSSPFNGYVYASYNDFGIGGGALRVAKSSDGGTTWSAPVTVVGSFERDIQLTGDSTGTAGKVYLAGMNEGGGGGANRTNLMHTSTDGGATWNSITMGPSFVPVGNVNCSGNSYFRVITPQIRHMGWGQPAAGPGNSLHYVYAQHGAGTDEGDIFYTRSTDGGTTWSSPLMLNTDGGTRAQWMPSIGVTAAGAVFVKWYDRRNTTNNDYEVWGRESLNNGASWLTDQVMSDAVIPQPSVQTANCYMGDYDYWQADGATIQGSWTDSRASAGTQDVYHDREAPAQGTPTPTRTGTPPTVTRTSTPIPATATPCAIGPAESFETGLGTYASSVGTCVPGGCGWASVTTAAHTGTHSAFAPDLSNISDQYLTTISAISVPPGATLSFWHRWNLENTFDGGVLEFSTNNGSTWTDAGAAILTNGYNGTISTGFQSPIAGREAWTGNPNGTNFVETRVNLAAFAGQNLMIRFREANDNSVAATGWWVDDVQILGSSCGSVTPVATATRTPVGPTPTCAPSGGGWTAGPDLPNPPQVLVRAVGVYFPTNGKFYSIGGRTSDVAGSDYQKVLEYTPGNPGTWVQKGVTLPDNNMNNMACGVLTVSGTPQIYCVGGSFAGGTSATARVFSYNPATDTATTLAAGDNWPGDAAGTILPGGFAVANNKLYILGGFNINVASTNQIWEFDPTLGVGAKWTQKVNAPTGIMYAPAATIGGIIYVGGASDYQGAVVDTNTSFSFNPVANTIGTIATIPRATGETRAVVVGGNMWVLGGGRVAPNPSTEVNIYNPGTNTWSVGAPFSTARRNFPADSDGSTVWLAGGYATDGLTPLGSMEIFSPPVPCSSPTPGQNTPTVTPPANTATRTSVPNTATSTSVAGTATNTPPVGASPTNTPPGPPPSITPGGPTPTTCPIQFSDVPVGSTFYEFIRCLACRGIINGYPDGTFRPNNNVTRGQLSKIVSNSAGFSDPATQMFEDVPPGSTFFDYIGRLASRGYINGYPCGGPGEPCVPPGNLPYFRPNANATRGQISKIVSNAAGFIEPVSGQTFQDVPPGSTFYEFIERLATRGVMSGYPCGSLPTEPCVPPENRPYFRPNNNATRGQTSKIVANTFFPNCVTPSAVVASR